MKKKLLINLLLIFSICFLSPLQAWGDDSQLVEEIKDILWEHYVEPVPFNLLSQRTVQDVLKTLDDPYTKYFTDEEFQEFWFSLEGKFGGIGVTIEIINGKVTVTSVIPNTPAAEVKIQKGDIITHVNYTNLNNLTMDEIKGLFRGKPGTYIKIRTYRPSTATYLSYLLSRQYINETSVTSSILTENIGYIKLTDFNQETATEFTRQLQLLEALGARSLILDLRDNPGGLIGSALDISRELIPPGLFVILQYRGDKPELITTLGNRFRLPLIVLVNNETASAAEILAGAVQDSNSGYVIGSQTYGKATVQSLVPLVHGGALKFTSAKYITPKGRNINKIGLNPDFYIKDSDGIINTAIWMFKNKVDTGLILQSNNNTFFVENEPRYFTATPYLDQGHLMAPLRPVIESLGGQIEFSRPDNISIFLGNNKIDMNLSSNSITLNGDTVPLKIKPILKNQNTLVPIDIFADLLAKKYVWRESTGQIIIYK